MKIYSNVVILSLVISAFTLNAENTAPLRIANEECCDDCVDCDCVLDGRYSYEVAGRIGTALDTDYQEVGVMTFDCETRTGCITALALEDDDTTYQNITYDFNYIFIEPGLIRLTLTRNQGTSAIGGIQWAVSYGENCDHISIEFLPSTTSGSTSPVFTNSRVIGTGGQ